MVTQYTEVTYTVNGATGCSIYIVIGDRSWTVTDSEDKILQSTVGTSVSLTATAGSGYNFTEWSDGATDNPYTYTVPSGGVATLEALFEQPTPYYTISASAGTGGSISPSGSVSVEEGTDQTFTITSNSGYEIAQILVDGSPITL